MLEVPPDGEYFKLADTTLDSTKIQASQGHSHGTTDRGGILTECANLCALGFREASNAVRKPTNARCTGFAIEGDVCTLLYPRSREVDGYGCQRIGQTVPFSPAVGGRVYSVSDCLALS